MKPIRLRVPFYRQHYGFTCGPASLVMAMKYFEGRLQLTKELEMDIRREGSMVEIYGTSRYGLAFSAAARGFAVKVFSNIEGFGFVDKLTPKVEGLDRRMLRLLFQERKRRCLKLGVKVESSKSVALDDVCRALASNEVPLLLTSTRFFGEGDDLPHWVVVTGAVRGRILVNNPLGFHENTAFPSAAIRELVGYKDDQCMVSIGKLTGKTDG